MFTSKTLRLIFIGTLLSFIVNKFVIRPYVLENISNHLARIFVYSYPNFCEAIMGSFILVGIFLRLNQRYFKLKEHRIYILGSIVAAFYVILQEFKIHNLGGNNTYDPYDVVFSIVGLIAAYFIIVYSTPARMA